MHQKEEEKGKEKGQWLDSLLTGTKYHCQYNEPEQLRKKKKKVKVNHQEQYNVECNIMKIRRIRIMDFACSGKTHKRNWPNEICMK